MVGSDISAGKCGHGLTCRPRETAGDVFLDDVLQLYGCLGASLLAGSLNVRCCSAAFFPVGSLLGAWLGLVGLQVCSQLVARRWGWLRLNLLFGCLMMVGSQELEALEETPTPKKNLTLFTGNMVVSGSQSLVQSRGRMGMFMWFMFLACASGGDLECMLVQGIGRTHTLGVCCAFALAKTRLCAAFVFLCVAR